MGFQLNIYDWLISSRLLHIYSRGGLKLISITNRMSLIDSLWQVLTGFPLGSRDSLPDLCHRRGFSRRHRRLVSRVNNGPSDGATVRVAGGLGACHYCGTALLVESNFFWLWNTWIFSMIPGLSIKIKCSPYPAQRSQTSSWRPPRSGWPGWRPGPPRGCSSSQQSHSENRKYSHCWAKGWSNWPGAPWPGRPARPSWSYSEAEEPGHECDAYHLKFIR